MINMQHLTISIWVAHRHNSSSSRTSHSCQWLEMRWEDSRIRWAAWAVKVKWVAWAEVLWAWVADSTRCPSPSHSSVELSADSRASISSLSVASSSNSNLHSAHSNKLSHSSAVSSQRPPNRCHPSAASNQQYSQLSLRMSSREDSLI